ncbi:MAG: Tyrosine-specific transport protein [Chlamydiales bacterium]|nr:Tyrosine-specific transport protein [Chlamydiales bacterium]MCH9635564.1 Tyrosine-specific transport protein [Chlamydiales bacterium]
MLISGTAIGGGMLALPIATSPVGLLPASLLFLLVWAVMTFTAFLLLECNLSIKPGANLISMSRSTLGIAGQCISWISYLALLYSLLAVYISGTSALVCHALSSLAGYLAPPTGVALVISAMIIPLVIYGVRVIDRMNRFLILIGGLCYGFMLVSMTPHFQIGHCLVSTFAKIPVPLPVLATAFGFHIILPTLVKYLNGDIKALRISLIIGSLCPLVLYLGWIAVVMGCIPPELLRGIQSHQDQLGSLIEALSAVMKSSMLAAVMFSFCGIAILTSLFGVAISLWDFLADGFSTIKWMKHKAALAIVTFIPPLWMILYFPSAFTSLLGYAGIFVAILSGLLPIAMCWQGRKKENWALTYRAPGGKVLLIGTALFCLSIIVVQIF